ncbi:MAG TPA: 1-(5-phosphoribosyl)-5-[(5-phosphoribosylamino)methylideneamino]imidazole-4-carboxamide isomerase [Solirubrobacteraceae bacterium]|jgi:phosphoribosylformimino-5-aminoimidazole carboxamide ribotide isomerase|nr:1-(5-phosphoribosyl)-5-[(5-phosphoribosylamino)methylideneamino]imidazole-4-carboxamide isomerase [Solirubrobacteraceae bacterium]
MILLPAIDIIDGKAVRLQRGDFARRTNYDADPLDAAKRWVDAGARALHIVDLDGARAGIPTNVRHIERIATSLDVPVQVGGGLRSLDAVRQVAGAGAGRLILGTAAFRDPEFLDAAVSAYPDEIVVSVDARDGRVAAAGWTEETGLTVADALAELQARGVRRFVYSNIDRDGMLSGPDLDGTQAVATAIEGSFVYSGGIGELSDLEALAQLREPKLSGVIVGKAIYERRFDVGEAQALLDTLS